MSQTFGIRHAFFHFLSPGQEQIKVTTLLARKGSAKTIGAPLTKVDTEADVQKQWSLVKSAFSTPNCAPLLNDLIISHPVTHCISFYIYSIAAILTGPPVSLDQPLCASVCVAGMAGVAQPLKSSQVAACGHVYNFLTLALLGLLDFRMLDMLACAGRS